ncbi:MAG: response regulator, partial [Ghiorsea sp.]
LSKQHLYRPEKMKLYLERIEDSCNRASDLCRQILAYSGMGRYTMTETNPTEFITSMSDILTSLEKRHASIDYDLATELPNIKTGTPQLQQVLVNLVNNAYEAGPLGITPHVVVRPGQLEVTPAYFADAYGTRHSLSGQFVWIEVSDNGVGMDESMRNRIFEPFFSTKHQSRGLGMSATLGIIRGHGGAIKVWSDLHKGTTVRILLPAAIAQNEDIAAPIIDSFHSQRQTPITLSGTILIVDDEDDIREMLRLNLESMGCHVLEASDGEEGLKMYHAHQDDISVVLLDMAMPNMDGAEMMEALDQLDKRAHIVVISGYSEKVVQGRFSNFEPDAFLYKPFEIYELQTCLKQILNEGS